MGWSKGLRIKHEYGQKTKSWLFLMELPYLAGWWFGCHQFYFSMTIGNVIIPIDELIFFRTGWRTAHQPVSLGRSFPWKTCLFAKRQTGTPRWSQCVQLGFRYLLINALVACHSCCVQWEKEKVCCSCFLISDFLYGQNSIVIYLATTVKLLLNCWLLLSCCRWLLPNCCRIASEVYGDIAEILDGICN